MATHSSILACRIPGGAWWAAVYGVAQSQTRPMQLSSSSSAVLSHSAVSPWTVTHQAPLSIGILQTRILEWAAVPFSRGFSQPRDRTRSPTLQVDSILSESGKLHVILYF